MLSTCEGVREVLWPLDRPRAQLLEEETARTHLSTCVDCRAFFLRDVELAKMLRRFGEEPDVPAPTRLRAAVAESLAGIEASPTTAAGAIDPDSAASRSWRPVTN